MVSRKLVRDFFLSKQLVFLQLKSQQAANTRFRLLSANGVSSSRQFSVFNEFSKQVKGEAKSNSEFQQSIEKLKDKAGELKGVKEDLKVRTKQKTEQLYKHVDGVWTEAEATAKKVSANVKEKISAATEEVKETLGLGKQESSGSTNSSTDFGADVKDRSDTASGEEKSQQTESSDTKETLFGRFKSSVSSASPKVSSAFQKLKDTKVIDIVKKGYGIVKDELSSSPSKRRHMQYASSSPSTGETSTNTDIVIIPTKQSHLGKKWEALKDKMRGHPVFKRISGISEPVVTKGQEFAEDVLERWETSDHPVVHKIQDLNETVFGETAAALSFKEIRRRDPSFSLPEFVAEVQEMIRPTLDAYLKGDVEALKNNCSPEVMEQCKAERRAYESQGIFFDNKKAAREMQLLKNRVKEKILHISEVEVRETKLMGSTPIIIVAFQTQQIFCVRDKHGSITEGGKDTIHTVYYAWAMQQMDVEELGEGTLYPVWRLREMQQLGIQSLI